MNNAIANTVANAAAVFKTDTIIGDVLVKPHKDGVKVHAHFTKLPPGKHGFHIHKAGDLRYWQEFTRRP